MDSVAEISVNSEEAVVPDIIVVESIVVVLGTTNKLRIKHSNLHIVYIVKLFIHTLTTTWF